MICLAEGAGGGGVCAGAEPDAEEEQGAEPDAEEEQEVAGSSTLCRCAAQPHPHQQLVVSVSAPQLVVMVCGRVRLSVVLLPLFPRDAPALLQSIGPEVMRQYVCCKWQIGFSVGAPLLRAAAEFVSLRTS